MELTELLMKKSHSADRKLSKNEIEQFLSVLHGWRYEEDSIVKEFSFEDFYETIAFVNGVAYIANFEDHHPDLLVSFNKCTVKFNTHSVHGISENDFICAAKVDALSEHRFMAYQ